MDLHIKKMQNMSQPKLMRKWRKHSHMCRLIEVIVEQRTRKGEKFDMTKFNPQHPLPQPKK